MKNEIMEWIKSIGMAVLLGIIITSFIGTTKVFGSSMNPTLQEDDFLIILNNKNIEFGDIIIAETSLEINPEDLRGLSSFQKWKIGKTKKLIKRVVAVEGDSLIIDDGKVFLNGEELNENYIKGSRTFGDMVIERVPAGKIFVLGDNRENSLDSRDGSLGLIDVKDIVGKAVFRVYPFSKFGILK